MHTLQPLLILLILYLQLIIDIRQEDIPFQIRVQLLGILKILGLDDMVPDIPAIDATAGDGPHEFTGRVVGVEAAWDVRNATVLGSDGDEVVDWGVVAPLDVGTEELAALGETDGVESSLQFGNGFQLVAYYFDLIAGRQTCMHAGKERLILFWSVLKRYKNALDMCT